jgi:hypothetical protein
MSTTTTAAPATQIVEVTVKQTFLEARHHCYLFRVPADSDIESFEAQISDCVDELECVLRQGDSLCGGTFIADYESETHTDEWDQAHVCEVGDPQTIPSSVHVFTLKELVEKFQVDEIGESEFKEAAKQLAETLDAKRGSDEYRLEFKQYVLLEAMTRRTSYKNFRDHDVVVIRESMEGEFSVVKELFGIEHFKSVTVKKPGATF